jgi:steroid 5-alpha reductase family enzyme
VHWSELLVVSAASLGCVLVLMAGTAVWATRVNRVAVVDVMWGLAFAVVGVVASFVGQAELGGPVDEDLSLRRFVLVVVVAVWAARLASHIRQRSAGHGEDPRYEELLGGTIRQVGIAPAVRKVFVVQGVAVWVVSLPIQVGMVEPVRWFPVVWLGVAVWLLGLVFETVGDRQLEAYKALPESEKPPVMQTGLWRWTRHPNYFGDACVAWGFWIVGGLASGPVPALLTLVAPVAMTYFLVSATGARLLERTMMQRPGYPEYAARTSMFLPLPPKRG